MIKILKIQFSENDKKKEGKGKIFDIFSADSGWLDEVL